jgi:hypothetical protein
MKLRSFEELTAVHPITRRFTPLGLSTTHVMTRGVSAQFVQELVASSELAADVPEGVRRIFERLRTTHIYGLFEYDLFTVAESLAYLTFEGALRARFVAAYRGEIPFVSTRGEPEQAVGRRLTMSFVSWDRGDGSRRQAIGSFARCRTAAGLIRASAAASSPSCDGPARSTSSAVSMLAWWNRRQSLTCGTPSRIRSDSTSACRWTRRGRFAMWLSSSTGCGDTPRREAACIQRQSRGVPA